MTTYRTNQAVTLHWGGWAFRKFTVPKGTLCEAAANLPRDAEGRRQFWLSESTEEMRAEPWLMAEFEACGFLVPAECVSPCGDVLEAYRNLIK